MYFGEGCSPLGFLVWEIVEGVMGRELMAGQHRCAHPRMRWKPAQPHAMEPIARVHDQSK